MRALLRILDFGPKCRERELKLLKSRGMRQKTQFEEKQGQDGMGREVGGGRWVLDGEHMCTRG